MSSDNFLLKLNQSELNPIYIIKESTNLIFLFMKKDIIHCKEQILLKLTKLRNKKGKIVIFQLYNAF
jgi:hypothetical protein